MTLQLAGTDGGPTRLTVADVCEVARLRRRVQPLRADGTAARPLEADMAASEEWVSAAVAATADSGARPVYGINTGFGALAGRRTFTSPDQARALSRNLVVSHSVGVGPPLPEDVVRAAMLIRVRQLAQGFSGIRVEVVNRLIGMLNADVYPDIPSYGSLGASGDLAPLAHLALVLSRANGSDDAGVGHVWIEDLGSSEEGGPGEHRTERTVQEDPATMRARHLRRARADEVMDAAGGAIELAAKEGLALSNGATFSAALLALAVADARNLLDHFELATAMTLEGIRGFRDAFLPQVHAARPHACAAEAAARILSYVAGSTLIDVASAEADPGRLPPQDPYSVRCAPQVLGAARAAVDYAASVVEVEINSAVDNPLIFAGLPRPYKAVSCGNFHGAPLGYALDFLKVVLTDVASQSERRSFKLTDFHVDGPDSESLSLPSFLVAADRRFEGLHSGLMIAQYTAAGLASACKTLAHPDSVDSIPSSANQEDHVSMSMNAGLHTLEIVRHATSIAAVELLCAAQAIGLREAHGAPGAGVAAAVGELRRVVPFVERDRVLSDDVAALERLIRGRVLLDAARGAAS
jgi:histidine ammonia-lyase